jgi:hypothetical protein
MVMVFSILSDDFEIPVGVSFFKVLKLSGSKKCGGDYFYWRMFIKQSFVDKMNRKFSNRTNAI